MFISFESLITLKKPNARLMGFDIGDRRIGVSVSDATWMFASPAGLLDRQKDWMRDFTAMFKAYPNPNPNAPMNVQNAHEPEMPPFVRSSAIASFVVGLPLLLNGDEGPQAQKVRAFCEKHLTPLGLPIFLWDERLSTHGANRALMEADMSRDKRKQNIDKMAAVFILQGVLDRLRSA